MSDTHLMIVHPHYAAMIMTGQKLVEARLGVDRRAPFNQVQPGDEIFIKPTGQQTIAKAIVERVDQFEGLDPQDIDRLQDIYNDLVKGDDVFWKSKHDSNYATFITLGKVRMIQDDSIVPEQLLQPSRNAWRVLSAPEDEQRQAA